MELSELVQYAQITYGMVEKHMWADYPGFSVLCAPESGKWLSLLMRQWNTDSGEMMERCDLRIDQSEIHREKFLTLPFRMRGSHWTGILMDEVHDPKKVFRLFDKAVEEEKASRFTIVINPVEKKKETHIYTSSVQKSSPSSDMPRQIAQMRQIYRYDGYTFQSRCENFCIQGKFMENYEDDFTLRTPCDRIFPTYHDLNLPQLRTYFSFRSQIRKGSYPDVSVSYGTMYLYELLNNIGVSSPSDAFQKMQAFEENWPRSSEIHDLRKWMTDYAVIHDLDPSLTRSCMDETDLQFDQNLAVLKDPRPHADEEICRALNFFFHKNDYPRTDIYSDSKKAEKLMAQAWKCASETCFEEIFGKEQEFSYRPLANAVWLRPDSFADQEYVIDASRKCCAKSGIWKMQRYDRINFRLSRLEEFRHCSERIFRKALKTGHALRKKEEEAWAEPFAQKALQIEQHEEEEARRPRIDIHYDSLNSIRADAAVTRDSLLTEEEMEEEKPAKKETPAVSDKHEGREETILRMLCHNEDIRQILKNMHVLPSVIADAINEKYYDEIGDSIVSCDGDTISLVEDYREDIQELIGGEDHE